MKMHKLSVDPANPMHKQALGILKSWFRKSSRALESNVLQKNLPGYRAYTIEAHGRFSGMVLISAHGKMLDFHVLAARSRMLNISFQRRIYQWLEYEAKLVGANTLMTSAKSRNTLAVAVLGAWGFSHEGKYPLLDSLGNELDIIDVFSKNV